MVLTCANAVGAEVVHSDAECVVDVCWCSNPCITDHLFNQKQLMLLKGQSNEIFDLQFFS